MVTHEPPNDWEHAGTAPFTFVNGVQAAIRAAQECAGDRIVDVGAGQIGGQALQLGLIDQVVVNLVPVVFGSGRPFFATGSLAEPILFENPSQVVQGDPRDAPRIRRREALRERQGHRRMVFGVAGAEPNDATRWRFACLCPRVSDRTATALVSSRW